MQHDQKSVRELPTEQVVRTPGPVEIDPALFALVSGGAPRSGWSSGTTTSAAELDAPRSGWL